MIPLWRRDDIEKGEKMDPVIRDMMLENMFNNEGQREEFKKSLEKIDRQRIAMELERFIYIKDSIKMGKE